MRDWGKIICLIREKGNEAGYANLLVKKEGLVVCVYKNEAWIFNRGIFCGRTNISGRTERLQFK